MATEHALFLWDVITGQMLWLLHAEIHAIASSQYNPLDEPLIVAAVQSGDGREVSGRRGKAGERLAALLPAGECDAGRVGHAEHEGVGAGLRTRGRKTGTASVRVRDDGEEGDRESGRGEVKETTEATEEETTISAFDEVFDVDQVEKEAENLRKGRDYSRRGGTVRRRRSAEDEGLLCHAKRTDPHAASALGPLPVLLRQGGHQVVLLFSNCLFTLIVLMREQV